MTHTLMGGCFHLQNTFTVFPHTHHHHFKRQPAHSGGKLHGQNCKFSTESEEPSGLLWQQIKTPDSAALTPWKYLYRKTHFFLFFPPFSVYIMQNSVWATQTHYRPCSSPRGAIYKHGQGRHTQWYSGSTRDLGRSASNYLIRLLGSFLYDKIKNRKLITTDVQSLYSGVCP